MMEARLNLSVSALAVSLLTMVCVNTSVVAEVQPDSFAALVRTGNPTYLVYQIVGVESKSPVIVDIDLSGALFATPVQKPDLHPPTDTDSCKIECNRPNSNGSATLKFQHNNSTLKTLVVTWSSSKSGCVITQTGVSEIPTLSEWALIVFSVLLLAMMTYYVIRRRGLARSTAA